MRDDSQRPAIGNKQHWMGRVISVLPSLFLLIDGGMKLVKPAAVIEASYDERVIVGLGVVLVVCTVYGGSRCSFLHGYPRQPEEHRPHRS